MLDNLVRGLTVLGNGSAIAYLFAGSIAGMVLGVVPGLGGAVILTIVLAFVYHISITGTLCLFLATQAGSYFSASVTSILLNTPAHPEAFAVTFDGFPMAQKGEAGRALGISAASTCIGGLIGCAVLVGFIQIINYLPSLFHPPEMVALITIALLLVGTLGTDAVSKALISMGLAIIISTIGSDPITGVLRFTFSSVGLYNGVSVVGVFLGLFAIPQMALVFGTASTIARQNMLGQDVENVVAVNLQKGFGRQVLSGVVETFRHWGALVRAALIGVVAGIIPGIGGFAANFMSYGIAQQSSRHPERFGTGIVEGIIAPEGSSLAKEAGGMVPVLGLGVPGGIGSALFLAALTIKSVKTGYGFTTEYPTLAYETVWVIALGGLIGTTFGVLTAPVLAHVTRVPGPALVPFIMSVAVLGTFAADASYFSVMEIIVFAIVGFVLRRLRYSLAAFGIGLVLGQTLESNIYLTHILFPGVSFLGRRPLADALFVLAIVLLCLKAVELRKARRKSVAGTLADRDDRDGSKVEAAPQGSPYPLLSVIATTGIIAFCVPYTAYAVTHYDFTTALMPVIGGSIATVVALWRLPFEIIHYRAYRRSKRAQPVLRVVSDQAIASEPVLETVLVAAGSGTGQQITVAHAPTEVENAPSLPSAPEQPEIHERSWGVHGQYTREVVALAWFAALIAVCYLAGFYIGLPLFCVLYALFATRQIFASLRTRVLFGIGSAVAVWACAYEIEHALHINLTPALHF